jgi:hypothetical protein
VAYASIEFIENVLRDEFITYPSDLGPYLNFAQTIIDSRLIGAYATPFDDDTLYPGGVPALIQWVTAYLVAFKFFDERTAIENLGEDNAGKRWWDLAMALLGGIVDGAYLLYLADGTLVIGTGSTSGPRSYPSGVREKAPSADNIPYFTREQAGNW